MGVPKCLREHMQLANSATANPFSRKKLKKMTKNVGKLLYDMSSSKEELISCEELIEYMDYIPEPRDLLYYKRKIK